MLSALLSLGDPLLLNHVWFFATLRTTACQASLSFTISQSLLKLMYIAIQPSHPVTAFYPCTQSFPESGSFPMSWLFAPLGQGIEALASAAVLPKNIQGCSFRIDWFDLLAVQGTLKRLLQHYSLKASVLRHSAFFMVKIAHPYTTTGKNKSLTIQMFVGKVMSLLFNTMSKFVMAFLPRSTHLSISSLQSPSAVILEPKNMKSDTVSLSPSICHKVIGLDTTILVF